jgi:hypothetical protein
MAFERPKTIDAAPVRAIAERRTRAGRLSWLSRGMGAAQGKKVARPRCGIGDRGAAALRSDQAMGETVWERATLQRSIKEILATSAQRQTSAETDQTNTRSDPLQLRTNVAVGKRKRSPSTIEVSASRSRPRRYDRPCAPVSTGPGSILERPPHRDLRRRAIARPTIRSADPVPKVETLHVRCLRSTGSRAAREMTAPALIESKTSRVLVAGVALQTFVAINRHICGSARQRPKCNSAHS